MDSILVLRLNGTNVDTVSLQEGGVRVTARTGSMSLTHTPPLGRRLLTAIGPGVVAQGFNDDGEFRLFGFDGQDEALASLSVEPREISTRERAEAELAFLARYGKHPLSGEEQRTQLLEVVQDAPEARFLPLVDEALFDTDGNLWLRLFDPDPEEEAIWEVHSRAGVLLARIEIPVDIEILELGPTYLLGLRRDSLDVETVVNLSLVRG